MTIDWRKIEDIHEEIRTDRRLDHLRAGTEASPLIAGVGPEEREPTAFIVAGAPGATEVARHKAFQGAAAGTLKQLMKLGGLPAKDCYMTYVSKYRLPGNRPIWPGECWTWWKYLGEEYKATGSPRLVIPVGRSAWIALWGRETDGISPFNTSVGSLCKMSDGNYCIPMFDPWAGLIDPKLQSRIEKDWDSLPKQLKEAGVEL